MGEEYYRDLRIYMKIGNDERGVLMPIDHISNLDDVGKVYSDNGWTVESDDGIEILPPDFSFELGITLNNEQKRMIERDLKKARAFANRVGRWVQRNKRKKEQARRRALKEAAKRE